MSTPALEKAKAKAAVSMVNKALRQGYRPAGVSGPHGDGAITIAAKTLGVSRGCMATRLRRAKELYGLEPDWSLYKEAPVPKTVPAKPGIEDLDRTVEAAIRKAPVSLAELASRYNITKGRALDAIEVAKAKGLNVNLFGERYTIDKMMVPAYTTGRTFVYESRPDNTYHFGVTSDNHLGSKYERLDALKENYDRFAAAGVDRVYNAGNWIEGEARFNRSDINVHGMERQLDYLAKHYPAREGIITYAVTGDDHEGWYAQRDGVDIGKRAEQTMRDAGRTDWVDLGYMEAHVILRNVNTGKEGTLAVVHPGGGSAYADSYVVQKIIESLDGGEKPSVALYGHYHKCLAGQLRNVWWILVPSTKDQDPFMRKKRIRSMIGGGIVTLKQDPKTGAITTMIPELWQFFNRGYYNDRWSHSGDVKLPKRKSGGF